MTEQPTEYNELVELIENNDAGTAAKVIRETHVEQSKLQELVESWRERAEPLHTYDGAREYEECADELEAVIEE